MQDIKIALISLGCEKNLVDSEMILGFFEQINVTITSNLEDANLIIVNTCGFIESAKQEAIDTIFDVLDYQDNGAKIVVTGCLPQRYLDDLKKAIPEVDLYVPIRDYSKFGELLGNLLKNNQYMNMCLEMNRRLISTPKHLAYVKISEGCNNCCAYCAIPLIRGSFVSFPEQQILKDVKRLIDSGRKEICLISQDLTRYGSDLENNSLASLIQKITQFEGDYWLRLLYLYPDEITDGLILTIKNNPKILPYFDIPIQHASNKILKWMNRRGTQQEIKALINKIREEIPTAIIRTTIIVGFPHETQKDFDILKSFLEEMMFDHLGVFMYSKEEDTKSYTMSNQVSNKIKQERYNELMEMQRWISLNKNKKHIGKILECIIEDYDENLNKYIGRTYMFAPEDIDGCVYITSSFDLQIGEKCKIKIEEADFYDLFATIN